MGRTPELVSPLAARKSPQGAHVRGLDVDEEAVGGVRRQPLLPGPQQVEPHHREQQQGQDTDAEPGDLEHGPGRAPGQGREPQPPDPAAAPLDQGRQADQQGHRHHQGHQGPRHPGQEPGGELDLPRLPPDQQGQGQPGRQGGAQGRGPRLILDRVAPRLPGPLIAVAGAIAASALLDLKVRFNVEMVGALPEGLPTLAIPTAPWPDIAAIAPTAAILPSAAVFAQSVSTASAFATAHDDKHNPNQDLVGLGAANIASGLGSSFVVNGSPTKTAISDKSGTRTQLAMLVLAGLTVVVLLFLTGVFEYLPESALAAVVFVIAIHLMKIPLPADAHQPAHPQ